MNTNKTEKLFRGLSKTFNVTSIAYEKSRLHNYFEERVIVDNKLFNSIDEYLNLMIYKSLHHSGAAAELDIKLSPLETSSAFEVFDIFESYGDDMPTSIRLSLVDGVFLFEASFNKRDSLFTEDEVKEIEGKKAESDKPPTWRDWEFEDQGEINEFINEILFEYLLNDVGSIRDKDGSAAYLVADVTIPSEGDYTGIAFKFSSLNKDKEFVRNIDGERFFDTQQLQFFAMNEFYKSNYKKTIDSIRFEILDPTIIHSQDEYDLDSDNDGTLWNDTINKNYSFDIKYVP